MGKETNRICPVERAGSLDSVFRKWLQDSNKIVAPYLEKGMTVLDIGCGPGFFSIEMARLVGSSGRVIAADLQQGMLKRLSGKIRGTELEDRIMLHRCAKDRIGLSIDVDFVLAFYMVHEVSDQSRFFNEIQMLLRAEGRILIVEPPFHVSKAAFEKTIAKAQRAGLKLAARPKIFLSKAAVFDKG